MRLFSRLALIGLLSFSAYAQGPAALSVPTNGIPGPDLPVSLDAALPSAERSSRANLNLGANTNPPQDLGGQLPVPEPSTLLLVGSGLVGLAFTARRRKRKTV